MKDVTQVGCRLVCTFVREQLCDTLYEDVGKTALLVAEGRRSQIYVTSFCSLSMFMKKSTKAKCIHLKKDRYYPCFM